MKVGALNLNTEHFVIHWALRVFLVKQKLLCTAMSSLRMIKAASLCSRKSEPRARSLVKPFKVVVASRQPPKNFSCIS